MTYVWDFDVEEISREEFPFENLNDVAYGNWINILRVDLARKYWAKAILIELFGDWHEPQVPLTKSFPRRYFWISLAYYLLDKESSEPFASIFKCE